MDVRPIRTETDYEAALKEIEQYFENEPEAGTAEADRFDLLAALIGAYEQAHWAIDAPDALSPLREALPLPHYTQPNHSIPPRSRSPPCGGRSG